MDLALKIQKTTIALGLFIVLALCVASTFSYKSNEYGDVNLVTAMGRFIQKNGLFLWYTIRFPGSTEAAQVFTAFNGGDYERGIDARAVPVLLYHGLRENDPNAVSPVEFAEQMHALYEDGWHTVTLTDVNDFMRGKKKLPAKSFLLTFDDGARDSYYPVDPVLALLHFNAVSFILPKYSVGGGTHYYLSSGEIRTMLKSGHWEIESHGQNSHELVPTDGKGDTGPALANHLWFPDQNRAETDAEYESRVRQDLRDSKSNLEKEFSVPIAAFAFPFGEFGQLNENYPDAIDTVRRIASQVYRLSFYQTWGGEGYTYNYPSTNGDSMLLVRRIEPKPGTSASDLMARLQGGYPKNLPYHDDFKKNNGWESVWGNYTIAPETLGLASESGQTGAGAVLDGTYDWTDYHLHARVLSPNRTGVYIWVRYKDSQNSAACNFGNGIIHAEDMVNGNRRVIKGSDETNIEVPSGEFTVDVVVKGRTITCTLNGKQTVSTPFLDDSLDHGGIGIKVWDAVPDRAQLIVRDLTVTQASSS